MKKQLFLTLVVALGFPLIMTLVPVCEAAQPENPDGFVAPAVFQAAGPLPTWAILPTDGTPLPLRMKSR